MRQSGYQIRLAAPVPIICFRAQHLVTCLGSSPRYCHLVVSGMSLLSAEVIKASKSTFQISSMSSFSTLVGREGVFREIRDGFWCFWVCLQFHYPNFLAYVDLKRRSSFHNHLLSNVDWQTVILRQSLLLTHPRQRQRKKLHRHHSGSSRFNKNK